MTHIKQLSTRRTSNINMLLKIAFALLLFITLALAKRPRSNALMIRARGLDVGRTLQIDEKVYYYGKLPLEDFALYHNLYDRQLGWQKSRDKCRELGMHLVSLQGKEKNDAIIHQLTNDLGMDGGTYWTSGIEFNGENNYMWSSIGEAFNYTAWAQGQGTKTDQNCVSLNINSEVHKQGWFDAECSYKFRYICENPCNLG